MAEQVTESENAGEFGPGGPMAIHLAGGSLALLFVAAASGLLLALTGGSLAPLPEQPADALSELLSHGLMWQLFFLFLATSFAPLAEWLMKHFVVVPSKPWVFRVSIGSWAEGTPLPIPMVSSFPVFNALWWAALVSGLGYCIACYAAVWRIDSDVIVRNLGMFPKGPDAFFYFPMFLLISATQVPAGYLAGLYRLVPSSASRPEDAPGCGIAIKLTVVLLIYNAISLAAIVFGVITEQMVILLLALGFLFLGVVVDRLLVPVAGRIRARVARFSREPSDNPEPG